MTPGTRLGPYEVLSLLGAGGMGEVYRAKDSTLKREVALKVLPADVAKDRERLARFQREAEVLASLNHPHIAQIYGLEHAGDTFALVMELVEGEDLAQRIARGPMPLDEALPIARQIAEALEAAHDHGIIHRDLKPANVKVRPDGTVKVLDFGLAKAIDQAGRAGRAGGAGQDLANSPTLALHATEAGLILGTAAYMSPEQAAGKSVDKRSDLWAFGVVLFEMLTGRQAFAGDTLSDVIAAVLKDEPLWAALPADTPGSVRRLLRRCLEKDRKRRLADAADARLDLDDIREPAAIAPGSRWSRIVPWAVAAVLAVALLASPALRPPATSAAREVLHFDIGNPPGVEVEPGFSAAFALSPDGSRFAFIAVRGGVRRLFVRSVTQPDLLEIPGTAGANTVGFAPDGSAVVFISTSGSLTTFEFGDTATRTVAGAGDTTSYLGWGTPGIVFQHRNEIWFVDPTGGEPRQLTTLDPSRGEVIHAAPTWLDNRVVAFASLTNEAGTERIETVTLDAQPRRTVIVERARRAWWSPGHLLFDRDGALQAVPFDLETLKTTGPAVVALPAATASPDTQGALAVQAAADGTLAYSPAGYGNRHIVMVSRDGSSKPLDVPPARFTTPRFSPDGTRLAVDDNFLSVALIDLTRGTQIAAQEPGPGTGFVAWNSDGSRLAFRRYSQPVFISADGKGDGGPIKYAAATDFLAAAGANPDEMLMVRITPETSGDILLFSLSGAHPPKVLIAGRGYQGGAQLSPDRRWMLYQSDETGQPEIYVRAYPALDRAWQVSVGGGMHARWGAGGREVLYRTGSPMVAVAFDGGGVVPVLGKPQTLFEQLFDYGRGITIANYDVSRDGRFVMLRAQQGVAPFHVIRNWAQGLKK